MVKTRADKSKLLSLAGHLRTANASEVLSDKIGILQLCHSNMEDRAACRGHLLLNGPSRRP